MPGPTQNRIAKARRFADFIERRDIMDEAKTYSEKEWAEIAAQADEKPPSEETVAAILEILDDRAVVREKAVEELRRLLDRADVKEGSH